MFRSLWQRCEVLALHRYFLSLPPDKVYLPVYTSDTSKEGQTVGDENDESDDDQLGELATEAEAANTTATDVSGGKPLGRCSCLDAHASDYRQGGAAAAPRTCDFSRTGGSSRATCCSSGSRATTAGVYGGQGGTESHPVQ